MILIFDLSEEERPLVAVMDSLVWGSLVGDMGMEGPRKRVRRDAPDIVGGIKEGFHTVEEKAVDLDHKTVDFLDPATEQMQMKSW